VKNTAIKPTAPKKYRSYVSECNFDFCMHYDENRRRCALRRCFYDRSHDDKRYMAKRKDRRDIEEEMKWHG
jgi:putative ribosome biogenesis GTPase RsgA